MVAFSVLRQHRLKTAARVAAVDAHNRRVVQPLNANPAITNSALVDWTSSGHPTMWAAVQARIVLADQARLDAGLKVRKRTADYVPAYEMVLSASPEFFRPDDPDRYGHYEPGRLAAWLDATRKFLDAKYGDRIIDARLHLDEATPHIQAVIVPITKDNRVSAKDVLGNATTYSKLQTEYAQAVGHLGIARGIEKSRATHTTVAEHYSALNAPTPEPPTITVGHPPLTGRDKWSEAESHRVTAELKLVFEAAIAPAKQAKVSARRAKEAQETAAAARAAAELAKAQAAAAEQRAADAQQRARQAEQEAWSRGTAAGARLGQDRADREKAARAVAEAAQTAAEERAAAAVAALKAERQANAARLRDIPLDAVLRAAGWDADPDDQKQWLGPAGGRISLDGVKWFDHAAGRGGGKAIDLAKHLAGTDFEGAMGWLGQHFGAGAAQAAVRVKAEEPPPPKPAFVLPVSTESNKMRIKTYLTEIRKIHIKLVEQLFKTGRLLADNYANAVFAMRSPSSGEILGAEKRGTDQERNFHGAAAGTDRNAAAFFLIKRGDGADKEAEINGVFVTESAIDAMSAVELTSIPTGQKWMFASTAGARPDAPWLRKLVKAGKDLVIGFDADEAGDRAAEAMQEIYPDADRVRPPNGAKDWNEALIEHRHAQDRARLAQAAAAVAEEQEAEEWQPEMR